MNLRKNLLALSVATVFAAAAPQALASGDDEHENKSNSCEPKVLSSAINEEPNDTDVNGVCLDLAPATSKSGPATTKQPKVEAWLIDKFVELTLVPPALVAPFPSPGGYYLKSATNVLETVGVCLTGDSRTGITTLRITRPYLSSSGKAKTTVGYAQVAVVFNGGCGPGV